MASGSVTTSSNPLDERFSQLRARGKRALVCYVTAGYPDRVQSVQLIRDLEAAGADVIEVGVPFSDPLADGPVIQAASQRALAQGMTYQRVLDLVAEARPAIPVVVFSYLNPIMAAGPDALKKARAAGAAGILITDLPVGADPARERWLGDSGLAFIRLVAPTTPTERMAEIARHGRGFVYLISRLGVTGARAELPADLPATLTRLRSATTLPICVGFGISRPEHAAAIGERADGIVVGSALVAASGRSVAEALAVVRGLRKGLDLSSV
jgi:tryptophan synthase alpha chain